MQYEENWGHKWARILRRVPSTKMPIRHALAHHDAVRNITFINADQWENLSPEQQQIALRCEDTLIID
jgi:hypothetical protein